MEHLETGEQEIRAKIETIIKAALGPELPNVEREQQNADEGGHQETGAAANNAARTGRRLLYLERELAARKSASRSSMPRTTEKMHGSKTPKRTSPSRIEP